MLPVVQFSTQAFAMYARLTSADVLFSSTMRHLRFFRYFWAYNAFIFVILIFILFSAIYFVSACTTRLAPSLLCVDVLVRMPCHCSRRVRRIRITCKM